MIDGISDRPLSQRLKELERQELIRRTVVPTTPVQIAYQPHTDRRSPDRRVAALGEVEHAKGCRSRSCPRPSRH
ncbi:winged helix-turn-helix transcriptional regulator [Streptomyces sp. T12]|uniref:winged helix-turn-helix transcriptional regulator n=1 Tax=Streptomyces sp. T12 TaxID=477697 RepID=UPI001C976492